MPLSLSGLALGVVDIAIGHYWTCNYNDFVHPIPWLSSECLEI